MKGRKRLRKDKVVCQVGAAVGWEFEPYAIERDRELVDSRLSLKSWNLILSVGGSGLYYEIHTKARKEANDRPKAHRL